MGFACRASAIASEADSEARRIYRQAIEAALGRCTPMPFCRKMGGAIAGRPITIRFVDDRDTDED